MNRLLAAALVAATTTASPILAQEMAADHSGRAAAADATPAARLNLDTPIEVIAADQAGKAVLDSDIPGLTTHEQYDSFKQMSLKQVANYAPDKLTGEVLAKTETDLAAVK